jgi:hypothetical protein
MFRIPRRFAHFVYGVIQSGVTTAIATGVASFGYLAAGSFLMHWAQSWLFAWIMMLPIVIFAAPAIRRLSFAMTCEESGTEDS